MLALTKMGDGTIRILDMFLHKPFMLFRGSYVAPMKWWLSRALETCLA